MEFLQLPRYTCSKCGYTTNYRYSFIDTNGKIVKTFESCPICVANFLEDNPEIGIMLKDEKGKKNENS